MTFYIGKEPFLIEEIDESPKTMITLCEPWGQVEGAKEGLDDRAKHPRDRFDHLENSDSPQDSESRSIRSAS